ncbi:hypothetical protein [Actinomadura sp. NEAU-AAG7]|uniref:hypothetical protein n=1 Tax=Actinomadura sp. NEAU-AAG7 TaxID=2839640 RepID=UPI001BE3E47D|nr:hypothetical protein [Actinomadura sp. NEAU-AAG7]MBT2210975.1 hypothetical protein [Actinomadura sp. NEAU-AAG7]
MASDEYYIVSAVKIRFEDGATVRSAARSELARLKERHGDDTELQRFFLAPPESPASAMHSPSRLSSPRRPLSKNYVTDFAGYSPQAPGATVPNGWNSRQ